MKREDLKFGEDQKVILLTHQTFVELCIDDEETSVLRNMSSLTARNRKELVSRLRELANDIEYK